MVNLNFNAIAFEHNFRLSTLKKYHEQFEKQLILLRDKEIAKAVEKMSNDGLSESDEEFQIKLSAVEHYTEEQFPQIFRSQMIVAIWALIETAVTDTANALQLKKSIQLSLNDLTRDIQKKKWTKYFKYILDSPLEFDEEHWKSLDDLKSIRNIIAHTGGARFQISEEKYRKLSSIALRTKGLTVSSIEINIESEYIIIQIQNAEKTLKSLNSLFIDA